MKRHSPLIFIGVTICAFLIIFNVNGPVFASETHGPETVKYAD